MLMSYTSIAQWRALFVYVGTLRGKKDESQKVMIKVNDKVLHLLFRGRGLNFVGLGIVAFLFSFKRTFYQYGVVQSSSVPRSLIEGVVILLWLKDLSHDMLIVDEVDWI